MMTSLPVKAKVSSAEPSPEVVQDYIACMLGELSVMANDSGLVNLSSLLQVTMLASRSEPKNLN